jgi:hypothetical protein
MIIGREVTKQNNKLVINLDAQEALRETVNILRKPHFDTRYFETASDASGYSVTLNKPAILGGLNIPEEPFEISVNERRLDTTSDARSIKVRNGTWTIFNGPSGPLPIVAGQSDFTERGGSGTILTDPYWISDIAVDTTKYINLIPINTTGNEDIENPTGLSLKFETTERSNLSAAYPSWRNIGKVTNTSSTILINQKYTGNIVEWRTDTFELQPVYGVAIRYVDQDIEVSTNEDIEWSSGDMKKCYPSGAFSLSGTNDQEIVFSLDPIYSGEYKISARTQLNLENEYKYLYGDVTMDLQIGKAKATADYTVIEDLLLTDKGSGDAQQAFHIVTSMYGEWILFWDLNSDLNEITDGVLQLNIKNNIPGVSIRVKKVYFTIERIRGTVPEEPEEPEEPD